MTTQMVNECTTNIPSKKKLNVMEMKKNYGRDMKIANYCKSPKQVETKGLISYFQSRHEAIVLNVCAIFCSNEEKGMVRNIFHWVWFLISMFFPQEEPNPQGILGEVFLLWWLPRGTEPPPPRSLGGLFAFMASERIRNPPRKLGRLLSSSWPLGRTESPKKFFGGVYCFSKEVFLVASIFKELILLMWLLGVQQVSQELGFETLRRRIKT